MCKEFFVHIPYDSLRENHERLLRLGACPEIYLDASALSRIQNRELERIRKRVERFPALTLHAPFMDISPGLPIPMSVPLSFSKMRKVMEIADLWGAGLVVAHFKYDPLYYHDHFDRWLDAAAEFFRKLLEESRQPMIALENVAEPTPYVSLQLAERIRHDRLIHCFDFGHHHVFGKIPFDEWMYYLRPRHRIHFHLHDNFGKQDDHLVPGDGSIDWQRAASTIVRLSADCSFTLEPHRRTDVGRAVRFYKKLFHGTK